MGSLSHCIFHLRVPQPATHLGSLSHCIFHLRVPQPATHLGSLSHCIFISWGLNPIALHIGIFIPHHTSSQGLHPFHITRSLSRCISQHLHPLHHCIQTQPTLHHINDPSGLPRPLQVFFTF